MIDYDKLLNFKIPEIRQTLTPRDAVFYALSIGFGQDPMDARQLPSVATHKGPAVVPSRADSSWRMQVAVADSAEPGSCSPMHRTGMRELRIAATTLRLTVASSSPNSPRRSACRRRAGCR